MRAQMPFEHGKRAQGQEIYIYLHKEGKSIGLVRAQIAFAQEAQRESKYAYCQMDKCM